MSGRPFFSQDEAEKALAEVEREKTRKDLERHPRPEIALSPEERKKALVVKDAAKFWNVPPHFVLAFVNPQTGDVAPYITKSGKLWILAKHNPRSVQTKVEPHPSIEGGWIATAEIVPDLTDADRSFLEKIAETKDRDLFLQVFRELTRPTTAQGTAHEGNLKDRQGPWAREMAETRALSRAISVFTGLALPVPEEREE
jgi:hypothetical protein